MKYIGRRTEVIDPSEDIVLGIADLFKQRNMEASLQTKPSYAFYTSGDPHYFGETVSRFLRMEVVAKKR